MPCPECQNELCDITTQFYGEKSFIIVTCIKCGLTTEVTGPESLIKFLLITGMR